MQKGSNGKKYLPLSPPRFSTNSKVAIRIASDGFWRLERLVSWCNCTQSFSKITYQISTGNVKKLLETVQIRVEARRNWFFGKSGSTGLVSNKGQLTYCGVNTSVLSSTLLTSAECQLPTARLSSVNCQQAAAALLIRANFAWNLDLIWFG